MSSFDLTCLAPAARRAYTLWMAGEDVADVLSQATMYRHRSAIMKAGGPDISLPKPTGDVVEFRRVLAPQVASVPSFVAERLYSPPRAA